MATADLNFCAHTCSCILNMFPKPYCGFVFVWLYLMEVPVSGLYFHLFKPENEKNLSKLIETL